MSPERAVDIALFFDWDCAAVKLLTKKQQDIYNHLTIKHHAELRESGNLVKWQMIAAGAWAVAYESV